MILNSLIVSPRHSVVVQHPSGVSLPPPDPSFFFVLSLGLSCLVVAFPTAARFLHILSRDKRNTFPVLALLSLFSKL